MCGHISATYIHICNIQLSPYIKFITIRRSGVQNWNRIIRRIVRAGYPINGFNYCNLNDFNGGQMLGTALSIFSFFLYSIYAALYSIFYMLLSWPQIFSIFSFDGSSHRMSFVGTSLVETGNERWFCQQYINGVYIIGPRQYRSTAPNPNEK